MPAGTTNFFPRISLILNSTKFLTPGNFPLNGIWQVRPWPRHFFSLDHISPAPFLMHMVVQSQSIPWRIVSDHPPRKYIDTSSSWPLLFLSPHRIWGFRREFWMQTGHVKLMVYMHGRFTCMAGTCAFAHGPYH